MPKFPLLVLMALALAGCNQSARETRTGGYVSYEDYLKAHQKGQVATAQSAPEMTENGSYAGDATATEGVTQGSIGADTLAALKATAAQQ